MMNKHFEAILREAGLLPTSQSLDALREMVRGALKAAVCSCDPTTSTCACTDDMNTCRCDDAYVWLRDLFADKVVYEQDGKLYQRGYKVKKAGVTFDAPIAVEIAYKALGESARAFLRESVQMTEAAYDKAAKQLTVTVIKPGLSKNKNFYPAAVIKRDHKMFEGARMFANHQTDAESRSRPEGDVNAWVASLKETWVDPSDGRMRGKVAVIDPTFEKKLENLSEAGLLNQMGISIRAAGNASPAEVDGQSVALVESFIKVRSVDFVTFAGAGGAVEAIESAANDEDDVELLTEATLRTRRPDLVELIESNAQEEHVKTLEVQLTEAQAATAAEKKRADEAEAKLQESAAAAKKVTAATELTKLLTEAKLPEKAADRIRKQFAEATVVEGMKEAIDFEREYIKSLGVTAKGVRNMGPSTVETREADAEADQTDEQKAAHTKRLVESYVAMGMPQKEAEIAASRR